MLQIPKISTILLQLEEENGGGKDRTRDHGTVDKFYSIKQKASSDASCYKLVLLFVQDGVAVALHSQWTDRLIDIGQAMFTVVVWQLSNWCFHVAVLMHDLKDVQHDRFHAIRVVINFVLWTFHRHCVLRVFSLLPSVGHEKEMLVKMLV